jgi:flagellar biosynthetic protein FliQ
LTQAELFSIASQAMLMTAKLALPFLITSLTVGLLVSLFQSVTSIQEVTLTFVPKLAAVAVVMTVAGHWMLNQWIGYTTQLYGQVVSLVGS